MITPIYTPSPIREQTAFMAALTKLRTEYEANMATLYAGQAEYKDASSMVETVKSFGFGGLDYLQLKTVFGMHDLVMYVDIEPADIDTLGKALKIAGLSFSTRTSKGGRRVFIDVPGFPKMNFIAPATTINMPEVACSA